MNLLLIRGGEREGGRVRLQGTRARHVREVLRLQVGESLRVAVPRESMGTAQVLAMGEDEVILDTLQLEALDPASRPGLRLILALPRPKALRRTLQTAASFGVEHIDVVNAWRVSKSYWGSPVLQAQALKDELWLGCEQGRHPHLPTIACHRLLMPFLDGLGSRPAGRYLAHPGSDTWLAQVEDLGANGTLAIGPEGGWIAAELESFTKAGFRQVTISGSILRSEIALAAALAQWQMCLAASK